MPSRAPAIALLCDRVELRAAIARRLTAHGPVLELASEERLLAAARKGRIDTAIIAIESDGDVRELVRALRGAAPALHVIVLSTPDGDGEELERAAIAASVVPALRGRDRVTPEQWARITTRQREVMRWLAIGLDNAAIGLRLDIGERAVKAHVSSLLELFRLDNRTQLALLADRAGMRPPGRR